MKTSEVLLAARELIATPEKWLQGEDALDADGRVVTANNNTAVRWCLVGALAATGVAPPQRSDAYHCLRVVMAMPPDDDVFEWNDATGRTHAEVIEALTKAAALAAAEEQS